MFIKKTSFLKTVSLKIFCDASDNVNFSFLVSPVKIWSKRSISIPIHPGIMYLNVAVCWGWIWRRGRGRGGEGALMSSLCLISHRWYDVEKLTVPGSSNLNLSFSGGQQKVSVKKIKEKCVTFCFIKLNAKVSPKLSGEEVILLCRS